MGGGDKCLLRLGDTTVLDVLLQRLAPQASALAISANGDQARFGSFRLPILPDLPRHAGPLAGVAAGLVWATSLGAKALLTVPGDTPFIPTDLAHRLSPAPAWAESGGAIHPLVALWPTTATLPLTAWLEGGGNLRVRSFGAAIGMRTVAFPETPDPFFNINTRSDLAAARQLAQSMPSRTRNRGPDRGSP